MIYEGFIELLDDLVPGMRAEMLNDRNFEFVEKAAWWCYYTGEPVDSSCSFHRSYRMCYK